MTTSINQIGQVKKIFKSNFTSLFDGKLIKLNEATLKVNVSYSDNEGGWYDSELILNAFNGTSDEAALSDMLEAIKEGWVDVDYKREGDDYIVTAGNNESVYVLKLEVFRIA